MEGERDPFDYMLAETLGMTVEEMHRRMSNAEHLQWRALYTYRAAQRELAAETARVRRG